MKVQIPLKTNSKPKLLNGFSKMSMSDNAPSLHRDIKFSNNPKLAQSTELRPVMTLVGTFCHTRLHLARLCVERKISRMPPNSADIPIYIFETPVQSQKNIHRRLHFLSLFTFDRFYYIGYFGSLCS